MQLSDRTETTAKPTENGSSVSTAEESNTLPATQTTRLPGGLLYAMSCVRQIAGDVSRWDATGIWRDAELRGAVRCTLPGLAC
eukprot:6464838-Amphidinium_carterae.1